MLDALNAQTAGTNASLYGTQAATQAQGNYLNIGQAATAGAQNAWQQNTNQNNTQMAGFGNLVGTAIASIPW